MSLKIYSIFLVIFLSIFFISSAQGQGPEGKNGKDTIRLTPPDKKNKSNKKTSKKNSEQQTSKTTDNKSKVAPFEVPSNNSIVTENTDFIDESVTSVVQVSEFLKIDCVWVKSAEYFSIWSSEYINPYGRDPSKFKDTIPLKLYDSTRNQFFYQPLDDMLPTSPFGPRWGRFHHGVDLNLKIGTPIYAIFDGIVRIATFGGGYGYYVVLRHPNGLETLYGHMSQLKCEIGQIVKAGELIGLGGSTGYSTGPHLHLEVRYAGNTFNPNYVFELKPLPHIPFVRSQYFDLMPLHFRHFGVKVQQQYIHVVKSGDTLHSIARRYGVSVAYLARLNRIPSNYLIKIGQRLRLK